MNDAELIITSIVSALLALRVHAPLVKCRRAVCLYVVVGLWALVQTWFLWSDYSPAAALLRGIGSSTSVALLAWLYVRLAGDWVTVPAWMQPDEVDDDA